MGDALKVALLTSGGDAPGMNMALWALAHDAEGRGWTVLGVERGLQGLIDGSFRPLRQRELLRWARRGGTELGTSRVERFPASVERAVAGLRAQGVERLVILGGNGSARAAALLSRHLPTAFIPATIDNDVADSDSSVGFDTALDTAVRLADGIRDSADSLPRLFVLETLGGDTGFLAQAVALATAADVLLVPEAPLTMTDLVGRVETATRVNGYALIVASEGYPELVATVEELVRRLGTRSRISRIGHAQRGGAPSAGDRLLARSLAERAVAGLAEGESGRALWRRGEARWCAFSDAAPKRFEP